MRALEFSGLVAERGKSKCDLFAVNTKHKRVAENEW